MFRFDKANAEAFDEKQARAATATIVEVLSISSGLEAPPSGVS
jgi:hypothetical protein